MFVFLCMLITSISAGIYNETEVLPTLETKWIDLGWILYGIITIVLCIAIATIVYIIGHVLDAQNLKRWSLSEGLNSIASAIMIILLILFLQHAFSYLTDSLLEGNILQCKGMEHEAAEPIIFAKCRVEEQIVVLDDLYDQIYVTTAAWEKQASRCYSFLGFTVWCGDWYGNTRKQIESGYLLTNKIIPLTIGLHSVWVFLDYISKTMLTIFLPLGLLLRAFPISRGVGGLLVAIAIGAYFIFPVLFVMLDPSFTTRPAGIDPPFLDNAYGCYPGFKGGIVLSNVINSQETYEYTIFSFQRIGDILVEITIRALFYPFVAFAASIALILALTPLLGGDSGDTLRLIGKTI